MLQVDRKITRMFITRLKTYLASTVVHDAAMGEEVGRHTFLFSIIRDLISSTVPSSSSNSRILQIFLFKNAFPNDFFE